MARPEGLLLPLGTPGRDSPCPWRKGLQRPLELVPRQVLPDGGLGAGGIPQFSPDHLGQRGGVSGVPPGPPSLPRPHTCRHTPHVPRAPRPGRDRDRVVTQPSSWPHPSSRASRHWGAGSASGCPVGPATQEAAGEAGSDPPRGRPWPSPGEPPSPAGSCKGPGTRRCGGSGGEGLPASTSKGSTGPADPRAGGSCLHHRSGHKGRQPAGRPEARPLGLARGLGHMRSTRPVPRGRGTLPGQACGDQEPHSLGRRGRVPGSTASSRPSRPPACPHGKAAATSRTAPGPGARPHPRPPAQPGPAPHEAPHIAHLTDDGLLLLAQVTLAAVRELPLQVLVHLQDLRATGLRVRGLETCRAGRPPSLCPFPSPQ